jgi:ArsR family transcriptional regulator, cadmium/lead-responsive transcriptional repressor
LRLPAHTGSPSARLHALDHDAEPGAAAGAGHDRHRGGQAERARAGDDDHRDRGGHLACRVVRDQPPAAGGGQRDPDYGRDEYRRYPVGQPLRLPLAGAGGGDQGDDLGERGLRADRGHLHGQRPAGVDRGAGHRRPGCFLDRDRLASEHGLIDRAGAVGHHAVGGDLLTGPDPHQVPGDDITGRDHDLGAVADHPGLLGAQLEQGADRVPGLELGARLEVAAQADERDDQRGSVEVHLAAGQQPTAALFRSLGDPARLAIVRRLTHSPARVTDLAGELGLAQSTVSKHLACLRNCGLVTVQAAGRASVYSLAQPALGALLAAAEDLLAATGNAVALCPVYGQPR